VAILSVRVRLAAGFILAIMLAAVPRAVTRLSSADGQFWDIQDTSPWAQDSGGIATGGSANPFNGFGYLKLQVSTAAAPCSRGTSTCAASASRMTAASDSIRSRRWCRTASWSSARYLRPKDTNYLRYLDSFTNVTGEPRTVSVAWGGAAGAFDDGGQMAVAATSNNDRTIDLTDSFVTVMQNARGVGDPSRGPSGHGPSAHVLGAASARLMTKVGDMYADPFADAWPGYDPAHVGYVFTLPVPPGRTVSLMTFVVKGLSETYDPRGGFPIAIRDGLVAPKNQAPFSQGPAVIPAPGSQIAMVTDVARRLIADPDLRGTDEAPAGSGAELASDWRVAAVHRGRENDPAAAGGHGQRPHDIGGHRRRVSAAVVHVSTVMGLRFGRCSP
jgi:hypothetical protein